MFIKIFDKKEYALDFYNKGVMKFSTSSYFNKLDDKERGDTLEGQIIINKLLENLKTIDMDEYKISYGGQIDGYTYSLALIEDLNEAIIGKLLEFGNGKKEACAIVIKNYIKFFERFSAVNNMTEYFYGKIKYVSDTNGYFPSVFHLKKEKANQVEFRIFLNIMSTNDIKLIKIGSIKDISDFVYLDDLRDYLSKYKPKILEINEKPYTEIDYKMSVISMLRVEKKDGTLIPLGTRFKLYKLSK